MHMEGARMGTRKQLLEDNDHNAVSDLRSVNPLALTKNKLTIIHSNQNVDPVYEASQSTEDQTTNTNPFSFSKNIALQPYQTISAWRKLAVGSWQTPRDPSIYGFVDFDARPLLQKQEELRKKGFYVTPTTIAAKAVALALAEYPVLNGYIRWGRIYQRKNVDIFLTVAADDKGRELSGVVIRNCDKKSLEEICTEIKAKATQVKEGKDQNFNKIKGISRLIPGWLMWPVLSFVHFILYNFNLWTPLLGLPKDGFGSGMVTSIGMLGIERGFAPLMPHSRNPFIIAVGKITDQVRAENGQVVIRPMLPVCATFDHRLIDGVGAGRMLEVAKRYFDNPS